MNKRIQQLALQSKLRPALLLHHWGKIDALTDSEQEELQQLEKFAQLIVQECMNAVCDPSTTHLESMTDASAMYTARERIRKRFRS